MTIPCSLEHRSQLLRGAERCVAPFGNNAAMQKKLPASQVPAWPAASRPSMVIAVVRRHHQKAAIEHFHGVQHFLDCGSRECNRHVFYHGLMSTIQVLESVIRSWKIECDLLRSQSCPVKKRSAQVSFCESSTCAASHCGSESRLSSLVRLLRVAVGEMRELCSADSQCLSGA